MTAGVQNNSRYVSCLIRPRGEGSALRSGGFSILQYHNIKNPEVLIKLLQALVKNQSTEPKKLCKL
jgi:hypothetical protein